MNIQHQVQVKTKYLFVCRDKDGNIKWSESFDNIVVNEGLNTLLTRTFKTIPANVDWFIGLKLTGTAQATDTLASHGSWTEFTNYSGSRKAFLPGTVVGGAVDNVGNEAVFAITGSGTVTGGFLASVASGTSGLLYGVGEFAVTRAVQDQDTLTVTASLSVGSS